jgi:hypothetical protein
MPKLLTVKNNGKEIYSMDKDGNICIKYGRHGNMTIEDRMQYDILKSYDTPVAAYDRQKNICYITKTKYSQTTTKHINKWVASLDKSLDYQCGKAVITKMVDQEVVNDILMYGRFEEKPNQKDRFEDLIID